MTFTRKYGPVILVSHRLCDLLPILGGVFQISAVLVTETLGALQNRLPNPEYMPTYRSSDVSNFLAENPTGVPGRLEAPANVLRQSP
ncbi:hypothetical protein FQN55_007238 [Onygenales sp. PD_40]|nr:hypothetical protein FQN55_007238 [Onygenales sp. PD_40]